MKNIETVVIDAGARYGLHPTWKPFKGELSYHMFDPDTDETDRLKHKYFDDEGRVFIYDQALSKTDGQEIVINYFLNKAMSSSQKRNELTELFKHERKEQVSIESKKIYFGITIDTFCKNNHLNADFLKLDTEGSEYDILQGAKEQITNNVLGVRSEVTFDYVFEGMPLFSDLNSFMLENGFFLLNLDYNGKGDNQSEFVDPCSRFGVLTMSDAVWLKRYDLLMQSQSDLMQKTIKTLKYAYFCMLNNAPDVAIKTLADGREEYNLDYNLLKESLLVKNLKIVIKKHLYGLKWLPGRSLESQYDLYRNLFDEEIEVLHEFMSSLELNPK
ncbi:MAG: FkbM family methyltransferase [Campylobacterales bacterium]|nr:FkbM family methyltransferase [Campylobacterales bacterium]